MYYAHFTYKRSAGDKPASFVGSHFFEDVSGRHTGLDVFEIVDKAEDHWLIKGTPKEAGRDEFAYYIMKIAEATHLPMATDYFGQDDRLYRQMEVLRVETIQDRPTVVHARMKDLKSQGVTEMQFRNVHYNLGLPDALFSERSLRTPPVEWLK